MFQSAEHDIITFLRLHIDLSNIFIADCAFLDTLISVYSANGGRGTYLLGIMVHMGLYMAIILTVL